MLTDLNPESVNDNFSFYEFLAALNYDFEHFGKEWHNQHLFAFLWDLETSLVKIINQSATPNGPMISLQDLAKALSMARDLSKEDL
jgi:hypothetical protein